MKLTCQKGVTLIELILAMIISLIAMMATATLFVEERSLWAKGFRETEAQRDAQLVLDTIARAARQSNGYVIAGNRITFTSTCGTQTFQTAGVSGDQFELIDNCAVPSQTLTLIDGVRSRVSQFVGTSINSKLIDLRLEVTRENQQREFLQTQVFLRNAS